MSFYKDKGICICERCGHSWHSSKMTADLKFFTEPTACGKCKSKGWNKPRVYAGKYISGVMARRFKPTGRAAAKFAPERIRAEQIADLKAQLKVANYECDRAHADLHFSLTKPDDRKAAAYYFNKFNEEAKRLVKEIKLLESSPLTDTHRQTV